MAESQSHNAVIEQLISKNLNIAEGKKTRIIYQRGEQIFKQGAFAPHVIYVVNGLVKVYLQTGSDKQINIILAKAGDFLAFASTFGENIHTYSAMAIKNSEVCMIERESLKNALLENPELGLRLTSRNYRIEGLLLGIIRNLSYKQMRGKLASSLLYLSQEDFAGENVFDFLTRQDIADFASISVESAIKFLKEFEKEEIVSLNGKKIHILDAMKLEQISKAG